jgi:hypothetical protein
MDKEYTAVINGETVVFEFKDSLIHAEGDAVGNIDAIITTTPTQPQNLLLDELHIKVPGTNEFLYIYGYGVVENSLKATFNSSSIVDSKNLPEMVEVYWGANGEQLIGEMSCRRYSEKIEAELSDEIEDSVLAKNDQPEKDKVDIKEEHKLPEEKKVEPDKKLIILKPLIPWAIIFLILLIIFVSF